MLRKPSFWIPLTIALALCVLLFFAVKDPLGDNLGVFVQAASALLLLAVTVSYVKATHDLAGSANEQVKIARNSRRAEATATVWDLFNDIRADLSPSIQYLKTVMGGETLAVNRWITVDSAPSQARSTKYDYFVDQIHRRSLLLPEPIATSSRHLALQVTLIAVAERSLASAIHLEIERSLGGQEPDKFRTKNVRDDWQTRADASGWFLSWEEFSKGIGVESLPETVKKLETEVASILNAD